MDVLGHDYEHTMVTVMAQQLTIEISEDHWIVVVVHHHY